MGLILDTSLLIASERRQFDMVAFMESQGSAPVYISSVTVSELLHGVYRSLPEYRAQRELFVEAIIVNTPSIAFDAVCARQHARLWAELASNGNMIGAHDLLIAATCVSYGHQMATLNEREFQRIPELSLVNARQYLL